MDFGFDFFLMEAQALRHANIFPKKHFSDGQLSNELFLMITLTRPSLLWAFSLENLAFTQPSPWFSPEMHGFARLRPILL